MKGPDGAGEDALRVENLGKHFGGLQVLEKLSFSVAAGERRAIIGPNGAGKTTLFNVIAGELPASEGKIFLFGEDVTGLPNYRRARLGLARTFQKNNLFLNLTVLDNLALVLQKKLGLEKVWFRPRSRGGFPRIYDEAMTTLETWQLAARADLPVGELSYGEQRQMEILLGLASGPRLLLLDEPTAGMSMAETRQILDLLRRLPPAVTLLIIEHDMDVVFGLADRITVLYYGRVLAEGTPEEIRADQRVREVYLGAEGELA